jgi:hypothetical protein
VKARLALFFVVLMAVALGAAAYWLFGRSGDTASAYAAILPTGPIDCPDDPNDLAGIEGWAPGAGKAEKVGQTDTGNMGGLGGALGGGAAATPAPAATKGCVGLRSDVAAGFDTIAERIKLVPTGSFDPAVRGADFNTPDAAFAFVRDSIHTEGYAGAMRGASGTLQSLGGSPPDKALLLAALLAHSQVPVRFVHAPLSDADVAAVVASVAASAPVPVYPPLDDTFKSLGIDAVQARADAAAARKRVEGDANAVIAGARTATDDVLATLASKNVTLSSDASSVNARWTANLRDHWWLQAQENGAWVDLDPTLPGAKSGTHLGGTPADSPADALPDGVLATLTVRLTADRFAAGAAPVTTTLVERTVKLPDAYAQPLLVSIGDRSLGSDKIAQATSFTPSISFGGADQSGNAFDTSGLGVVRLQVETAVGGTVRHVASRIVLDARTQKGDALDPSWDARRYAFALTTVYDVLPVAGELDPAFTGLREAAGMQTVRAFMAYAAAGGDGKQMLPPGVAETYPLQALRYFEYDALTRRLLEDASNGAVRFFFDRPQIAIERRGLDASGPVPAGIVSFDIADNGMIAAGSDRAASVRANVTRGYVDTEAEQKLFAGPNDGGTIALFDAAKSEGMGLTVLQGDQYGGTALAPVKTVALGGRDRIGWWAIDPQDGNLVGRMGPDGAGQELAEYAIARTNDWSTLYAMMQFYGDFFRCIAGTVEAPLSGVNAQKFFTQCAGAALCSYLEALTAGEAYSRWSSDEEALLYNILDLSIPGTKDSWPGSGGAVCGKLFSSPLY